MGEIKTQEDLRIATNRIKRECMDELIGLAQMKYECTKSRWAFIRWFQEFELYFKIGCIEDMFS